MRKRKKKERKKEHGVENFTVFSSILDTFFFNEKGEIIRPLVVKLVFLIQIRSGLQREGD